MLLKLSHASRMLTSLSPLRTRVPRGARLRRDGYAYYREAPNCLPRGRESPGHELGKFTSSWQERISPRGGRISRPKTSNEGSD